MDINSFRKDLEQKSKEANKTQFTENAKAITFDAIQEENTIEKYKELAETLEVHVHDLVEQIKKTKIRLGSKDSREKILKAGGKLATKDYNKNGVIETSTAEWLGARDNAIKKAMDEAYIYETRSNLKKALRSGDTGRVKHAINVQDEKFEKLMKEYSLLDRYRKKVEKEKGPDFTGAIGFALQGIARKLHHHNQNMRKLEKKQ